MASWGAQAATTAGAQAVAGVALPSGAACPTGVACQRGSAAPALSALPLPPRPVAGSSCVVDRAAHTGAENSAHSPLPPKPLGHAAHTLLAPTRKFRVMLKDRRLLKHEPPGIKLA